MKQWIIQGASLYWNGQMFVPRLDDAKFFNYKEDAQQEALECQQDDFLGKYIVKEVDE